MNSRGEAVHGHAAPETPGPVRGTLFWKYFVVLFLAVLVPLLANGSIEAWFGYRDQRAAISSQLRTEADSAAWRISAFLDGIVAQLGWMTQIPFVETELDQRRFDALRLLRQVPAVTDLAYIAPGGMQQLHVSRLSLDEVGSEADWASSPAFKEARDRGVYIGGVYFRRDSEPYVTIAVAGTRRTAGVSVAEVNLKLIWDVISKIHVGREGFASVRDSRGQLIAHPDISLVLRGADTPPAVDRPEQPAGDLPVSIADARGRAMLVATAPVTAAGWTVSVEQPLAEAFSPIVAALWRTAVLLTASAFFAAALAYMLARRMTGPIRKLESGAAAIGAGNFAHRIAIGSGDELERLASRFNEMAGELAVSRERADRIIRLRQFLAPQVAELVERSGEDTMLDSQRVEVVVLFCDLRNFTGFSSRADPDEIMGVLGEYYEALGPIITRYEATQTSFSGDGLMMLLNAPLPCPEPATRAIRLAIDMQVAVQRLAQSWRQRNYEIGFGIGLAKGPATVGRIGYENRIDYTAIGSVVNLASRLCASAADGQILIDAHAAAGLDSSIVVEHHGMQSFKGFDQPMAIYAVTYRDE